MDSNFIKDLIYGTERVICLAVIWFFIFGIIFTLSIGGLIWGGIYLYKNYSVVKTTNISTNTYSVK